MPVFETLAGAGLEWALGGELAASALGAGALEFGADVYGGEALGSLTEGITIGDVAAQELGLPSGTTLPSGWSVKDLADMAKTMGISPGALLGAVSGGLSGGSRPAGSTTTTTTQDLPDWYKPYAINAANAAGQVFSSAAPYDPTMVNAASRNRLDTINGNYLDPTTNPYLQKTYDIGAGNITRNVNSQFESAGRYGSGAHQGLLEENLGKFATGLYGQNYNTERARQDAASGAAPAWMNTAATAPYSNINAYKAALPPSPGTNSNVSTPYFTNPAAGVIGGALAGSQLTKGWEW